MNYDSLHEEMTKKIRPMGIKLNGIWQPAVGVYISIRSPYLAKINLNGKEFVVNEDCFLDFDRYSDTDIEKYIIQRNIQTLPALQKKKSNSQMAAVFS